MHKHDSEKTNDSPGENSGLQRSLTPLSLSLYGLGIGVESNEECTPPHGWLANRSGPAPLAKAGF